MQTLKTDKLAAVFLDRDGVLIHDYGYVHKVQDVKLFEDVGPSLKKLKQKGFILIVVTNQSGVARGYFNLDDVEKCHQEIASQLSHFDVAIDRFLTCPHHPKGTVTNYSKVCDCRKPAPGLIDIAIQDLEIDLTRSFMVGDKCSDIDCGSARGLKTIQIDRGQYPLHQEPGFLARSFSEACNYIIEKA